MKRTFEVHVHYRDAEYCVRRSGISFRIEMTYPDELEGKGIDPRELLSNLGERLVHYRAWEWEVIERFDEPPADALESARREDTDAS